MVDKKKKSVSAADETNLQAHFANALTRIMTELRIPPIRRASRLAELTGRRRQTTSAWMKGSADIGGSLPDLTSFASIVESFHADAHFLLGLGPYGMHADHFNDDSRPVNHVEMQDTASIIKCIQDEAGRRAVQLLLTKMQGDSMAPEIKDGSLVFVDASKTNVSTDGLYVVVFGDQETVRIIQVLPGAVELGCANPRYKSIKIERVDGRLPDTLTVIGKVIGFIQPHWI